MKPGQFYKLLDLVENIKKIDAMIKLHREHDESDFMLNQYEARKDKFVSILIDELVAPSMRSARSIHTIKLLIDKYYPETGNNFSGNKADDLTKLELAI